MAARRGLRFYWRWWLSAIRGDCCQYHSKECADISRVCCKDCPEWADEKEGE